MPESDQLQDSGGGNVVVLECHGDRDSAVDVVVVIAIFTGCFHQIIRVIRQAEGIAQFWVNREVGVDRDGHANR